MSIPNARFPFGRPARVEPPPARQAQLFVLGAYPSAVHIRWVPPAPYKPIKALAVDVEPHAFWNGADEAERVEAWKRVVNWRPAWGAAEPVGRLNGSSGAWVDEQILGPLGVPRDQAHITDCLHWYCASTEGARRIANTYTPFSRGNDLPEAVLPKHPSESEIVKAAEAELDRLRAELRAAWPKRVVTLGNAALRVLRRLVDGLRKKLSADASYGTAVAVRFEDQKFEVLALAHPAAPKPYQEAHARWVQRGVAE